MSADPIPFPEPPPEALEVTKQPAGKCGLATVPADCAVRCARLWAAIMGNGHPENAMATRVVETEKKVRSIDKKVWLILFGIGAIAMETIRNLIANGMKP
jgi:hypothetical protein